MKQEIKQRIELIQGGQVPKGYEHTPLGILPSDWKVLRLGDVLEKTQSGLSRQLSSEDIGIPVIRSNNIKDEAIDFCDIKYWYNVDNQGARLENYFLNNGDILLNFINSQAQIGKVAIYENRLKRDCIFTTNLMRLILSDELIDYYFVCHTKTKKYDDFIQSITKPAVNQASFTTVDFKKMDLVLPSKSEQQKIADILMTQDKVIGLKEKLIEDKKQQKKFLMSQLLSGEVRLKGFNGDWKAVKLDTLCKITTGKLDANASVENGRYPFFTCSQDISRINEYAFDCEAILLAGNGNVGQTKLYNGKFNAYQRTYILYEFVCDIGFIKEYIDKDMPKKIKIELQHGAMPYITLSTLVNFQIYLPPLEEQQAIANILSTADEEIALIEKELEHEKLRKKSLMQLLLTGIVRVSV